MGKLRKNEIAIDFYYFFYFGLALNDPREDCDEIRLKLRIHHFSSVQGFGAVLLVITPHRTAPGHASFGDVQGVYRGCVVNNCSKI